MRDRRIGWVRCVHVSDRWMDGCCSCCRIKRDGAGVIDDDATCMWPMTSQDTPTTSRDSASATGSAGASCTLSCSRAIWRLWLSVSAARLVSNNHSSRYRRKTFSLQGGQKVVPHCFAHVFKTSTWFVCFGTREECFAPNTPVNVCLFYRASAHWRANTW